MKFLGIVLKLKQKRHTEHLKDNEFGRLNKLCSGYGGFNFFKNEPDAVGSVVNELKVASFNSDKLFLDNKQHLPKFNEPSSAFLKTNHAVVVFLRTTSDSSVVNR